MTDQLKNMIDKLKEQNKETPKETPKEEPKPGPGPVPTPTQAPLNAQQPQEPKKELTQEQKLAISNRIQELQNNGLYRLESLMNIEELTNALKDLTLVLSSLIKQ